MANQQTFQNLSLRPVSRIKTMSLKLASKNIGFVKPVPNKRCQFRVHRWPRPLLNPLPTSFINPSTHRRLPPDMLNQTRAENLKIILYSTCYIKMCCRSAVGGFTGRTNPDQS